LGFPLTDSRLPRYGAPFLLTDLPSKVNKKSTRQRPVENSRINSENNSSAAQDCESCSKKNSMCSQSLAVSSQQQVNSRKA
jgi:hypothetical protein